MYLKYGSFQFEPWEATLQNVIMQTVYSVRQFKQTQVVQMWAEGTVVANDQYSISARLAQIESALGSDGYDFGLFHDDGTPTQHFLESSHPDNLTGNQVFMRQFPVDDSGAEYVTGRNFRFGIRATLSVQETVLLEYQDSYSATGDCGPAYEWTQSSAGLYVRQVTPSTTQKVVHSGYAVTSVPWFDPPAPYYSAPFYHSPRTNIQRIGPSERYPQGFSGFKTAWTYFYELPTPVFGVPTIR